MSRSFKIVSLALIALAAAGCARNEAAEAPPAPPQVSVAKSLKDPSPSSTNSPAASPRWTASKLRPRVSGYISSINFTEGHEVRKGDVLFVIDPRPYEAEFKRAEAELRAPQHKLSLAQSSMRARNHSLRLVPSRRRNSKRASRVPNRRGQTSRLQTPHLTPQSSI